MEVAASIFTLTEVAIALVKTSRSIISKWNQAPYQIQRLTDRLALLAVELESITNTTTHSHPLIADASIRQSLLQLLREAKTSLDALDQLQYDLQHHGTTSKRFH